MKTPIYILIVFFTGILIALSCKKNTNKHLEEKQTSSEGFFNLYTQLTEPRQGEWRYEQKEPEQTLDAYISITPLDLNNQKKYIYIQALGEFDSLEKKVLSIDATYLSVLFNCEVKMLNPISSNQIPNSGLRNNQISTKYIFNAFKNELPSDAIGLIIITNQDLYPGDDWNYVFGEAQIKNKIAIASFYRFGNIYSEDLEFNLCIKRLLKTTSHEFLHVLNMAHCQIFECVLNGGNSLQECDKQLMIICPACLEKLDYLLQENPQDYFNRVKPFFDVNGFLEESKFCEKVLTTFEEK